MAIAIGQTTRYTVRWRFYNSSICHLTQVYAYTSDEAWQILLDDTSNKLVRSKMKLEGIV